MAADYFSFRTQLFSLNSDLGIACLFFFFSSILFLMAYILYYYCCCSFLWGKIFLVCDHAHPFYFSRLIPKMVKEMVGIFQDVQNNIERER